MMRHPVWRARASFDRREFLRACAALGLVTVSGRAATAEVPRGADPFSLGVASGYPRPGGITLWTRLALEPESPDGGLPARAISVRWTVARDERFRDIAASGQAWADPDWAHSVHVEVAGLEPDRPYWYRFETGGGRAAIASPVGRTRTAPGGASGGGAAGRLRIAVASCQHFEQGHFNAYEDMRAAEPDLVLHLGDYIYESTVADAVRRHEAGEPVTLAQYRARHARYRSDAALRAMHAAAPWVCTWDDHEVENDYANDRSQNLDAPEWFLARRAAAYKAYWEHLPLPSAMTPHGPHARIHTRLAWGDLALLHVLDDRQYRSHHACPPPGRGGSTTVDASACAALADASRSMLGREQEAWLDAGLAGSRARWNLLAQQTLIAPFDQQPGEGRRVWTDGWEGYPAARQRLIDSLARHAAAGRAANPVTLGGDLHSHYVADLHRDPHDPRSPVVASEFVATSITSGAWPQSRIEAMLPDNPHIRYAETRWRGWLRIDLGRERLDADLRAVRTVRERSSDAFSLARFVVEAGRPGALKA